MEQNFGPLLRIDFYRLAAMAQWRSTNTALKWPVLGDSKDGLACVASARMAGGSSYPNSLLMAPPPAGGWIQGTFSLQSQPLLIPHKGKFSSKVGVTQDTSAPGGARFILGIKRDGEISYYPAVTIDSVDRIENYEVDLSELAGQKVEFIFRVESDGPWKKGSAAWIEPALIQQK
jgi:hypothetical protein